MFVVLLGSSIFSLVCFVRRGVGLGDVVGLVLGWLGLGSGGGLWLGYCAL